MSSYREYRRKVLRNIKVRSEYDALKQEYERIQAIIDGDVDYEMVQNEMKEANELFRLDEVRIDKETGNGSKQDREKDFLID